ncbi:MAG: bifunctional UDP-N-acetylmuramoyl-tripeptide:D-alanyl-D-alanine ligase/alanine racemase, partial [Pedobacter sp.]|nr:bifunctional UDP-N-acetylmuramoyl-tripeptide:D-alanyl-D-alanine ligase/alanine racemase [Chitinophagaceae bacterium]
MSYSINHIAQIIIASTTQPLDAYIDYLLIDSRKIIVPKTSLFFALTGPRKDGHSYIKEVYNRGVRNFVISQNIETTNYPEANFLLVNDVLKALQTLACVHRKQFTYPVIGITGSNGKTIVKEWLYQLLNDDYNIVRSPRSYNSQVGVPLSIWQMASQHTLGIFESGISTINEMAELEKIIQPTIGILTNIGKAHSEGFINEEQKLKEKIQLFTNCQTVIYCNDIEAVKKQLFNPIIQLFSWGRKHDATVKIISETKLGNQTETLIFYQGKSFSIIIPFTDAGSIDNAITCVCVLLLLNIPIEKIKQQLLQLQPIDMRMQLKKGINNCNVLNDSYSNDLSSLGIALDYLKQQSGNNKTTVILSDILQSGMADETLYRLVAIELQQRNVQ